MSEYGPETYAPAHFIDERGDVGEVIGKDKFTWRMINGTVYDYSSQPVWPLAETLANDEDMDLMTHGELRGATPESKISTWDELRSGLDRTLRDRGYDDYPADEELFENLLDDLVASVQHWMAPR